MAPFEVFQNIYQLALGFFLGHSENTIDNVVGPGLVSRIEVSRLRCRFEGPDNDPCRVWPEMQGLSIEKLWLGHAAPFSYLGLGELVRR